METQNPTQEVTDVTATAEISNNEQHVLVLLQAYAMLVPEPLLEQIQSLADALGIEYDDLDQTLRQVFADIDNSEQ
jgi:hypothetical protein